MENVYYPNGKKLREIILDTNGIKTFEKYYYESGEIKSIYPYKDELIDGNVKWFTINGDINVDEIYIRGVLVRNSKN